MVRLLILSLSSLSNLPVRFQYSSPTAPMYPNGGAVGLTVGMLRSSSLTAFSFLFNSFLTSSVSRNTKSKTARISSCKLLFSILIFIESLELRFETWVAAFPRDSDDARYSLSRFPSLCCSFLVLSFSSWNNFPAMMDDEKLNQ